MKNGADIFLRGNNPRLKMQGTPLPIPKYIWPLVLLTVNVSTALKLK